MRRLLKPFFAVWCGATILLLLIKGKDPENLTDKDKALAERESLVMVALFIAVAVLVWRMLG